MKMVNKGLQKYGVRAFVLVMVMFIISIFFHGGEAYAASVSDANKAKTIVVRNSESTVYEGQKLNENSFKKNARVYVKYTNGTSKKIKNYKIVSKGIVNVDKAGKYPMTISYNGKKFVVKVNVKRISSITVRSNPVKMVDYGSRFSTGVFKKKAGVYASYLVKGKKIYRRLPAYKVIASSKAVPVKSGKYKGTFSMKVKCGSKSVSVYIPVVKKIMVQSSVKSFDEGDKIYKAYLESTLSAYRVYADGKKEKIKGAAINIVDVPDSVKANGTGSNKGKFVMKLSVNGKNVNAVFPINKLSYIRVAQNHNEKAMSKDATFNPDAYNNCMTVHAYYKDGSHKTIIPEVRAASSTVRADSEGYFVVYIEYVGKKTSVKVPVIKGISATSNIKFLYRDEETKQCKDEIRKSLTVKLLYANGNEVPISNYKINMLSSVTPYYNEGNKFIVNVEYGSYTTKALIPVVKELEVTYSDPDRILDEGATFDKSDFVKNLTVKYVYCDWHTEPCDNFTISAPDKVTQNGTNENAGLFAVTVKEQKLSCVYYFTVNPKKTSVNEARWLRFYGSRLVYVGINNRVSMTPIVEVPDECGQICEGGVLYSHKKIPDSQMVIGKVSRTTRTRFNGNYFSEGFYDAVSQKDWDASDDFQYRIYAVVEKNGVKETYYSEVLHYNKKTDVYYFSH